MAKLKLYGIAALVAVFLYLQFIGLVEENAKQEVEISNLKEAAKILNEDSLRKSNVNIKRNKEIKKIQDDNQALKDELNKLETTPQQDICDATATPAGYADRLLKRTN